MNLTLAIDRVVVETELERSAAARIPDALRDAFFLLAEQLARSPSARHGQLASTVIELLENEPIAAEELLGPRGAERLAESLWARLAARLAESP